MKKLSLAMATALVCLFLTGAAYAQKNDATTADYTGSWEIDAAKSNLPEPRNPGTGTLVVVQTDKQITVTSDFKPAPHSGNPPPPRPPAPPTGENGGMRPNRGMRGNGAGAAMMGGGSVTYNLDGTEIIKESDAPAGAPSVKLTIKGDASKNGVLTLTQNREFQTQSGAMTVKSVETWELVEDGKFLKITRQFDTPRGSTSSEIYFTRKASNAATSEAASNDDSADLPAESYYRGPVIGSANGNASVPLDSSVKTINGGVINGKATKLPQPEYPPAAKAVNASGTVSVEVVLDEQGKVVSASAVSGHPLLKAAAEKAARAAEFSPTQLSGTPVRIKGVIVYNFIL